LQNQSEVIEEDLVANSKSGHSGPHE